MWNKWKQSRLYQKITELRFNRAVYLSTIVILITLAVVLAITAVTNRANKRQPAPQPESEISESTELLPEPTDETPTSNTPQNSPQPQTPPQLTLPTNGKISKAHDADAQVFSQTLQDYRVHLGIDIVTAEAAEVFAAADGTVKKIWEDPMMGWSIAIEHSGDCVTVYKNLSKDLAGGIDVGNAVRAGQLIGTVGDSALIEIAEEPHLHMEMTVKGLQVDPLEYFSQSVLATLSEDTAFERPVSENK